MFGLRLPRRTASPSRFRDLGAPTRLSNNPFAVHQLTVVTRRDGSDSAAPVTGCRDRYTSNTGLECGQPWRPFRADCVAKVECCRSINFSRKHKREAIADSYNLYRVTEVACEFNVRRWEPSHLYTKTAPVARRIFDHQCKTTFATQSTLTGLSGPSFYRSAKS